MDVIDFMKRNNKDSKHTDLIRESSFTQCPTKSGGKTQSKTNHIPAYNKEIYHSPSLLKVILIALDPYCVNLSSNQSMLLDKEAMRVATSVDTFPMTPFHKSMSVKKIQTAFQESLRNRNHLSLLYYLNEYYKRSFILIVGDRYWKTLWKKNEYPEETILYNKGVWSIQAIDISNKKKVSMLDLDDLPLIQDIKGIPYQTSYKAIGNYKLETLKDLCSDKNISLVIKDTNKKKRKEQLYHELLLEELSQSPSQQ